MANRRKVNAQFFDFACRIFIEILAGTMVLILTIDRGKVLSSIYVLTNDFNFVARNAFSFFLFFLFFIS